MSAKRYRFGWIFGQKSISKMALASWVELLIIIGWEDQRGEHEQEASSRRCLWLLKLSTVSFEYTARGFINKQAFKGIFEKFRTQAPPPPYLRHSFFDTFLNGVISAFTFYLPYTSVWGLWFKAFCRLVQQPNFNGDIGLHTKSNFNRLLLQEETRFFQYVFCIIHILPRALIVLWTKLG